jgi:DNA repair protein RecN (Recombination protein N)
MLQNLSIRDFAIVRQQELEFSSGFTAITGETGAGKSLIVDALGLLTGKRADTDLIRQGADKAELTGEFQLDAGHPALDWLSDAEMVDDRHCLLRRVISKSGRSRAWINGTAVTLNQLLDLGAHLVEIHGQNEHILLNQSAERYRLLDGGGGYDEALESVAERYKGLRSAQIELDRLREASVLDPGEIELLKHQLKELERFAVSAEAVVELETEQRRLNQGSEFIAALEFSEQALADAPDGAESPGVVDQINRVVARLEPLGDSDRRIGEAVRMLREAAINCEEARQSVQRAGAEFDLSPERLESVESHLGQLHDLARKHRVGMDELIGARDALAERIEASSSLESRLVKCEDAVKQALAADRQAAAALHEQRRERASQLSEAVSEVMQGLSMEGGQFEIEVELQPESEPRQRGSDRIALNVSATPGIQPGPLSKVASGGELSRICLALKVAQHRMRKAGEKARSVMPVQVFDEVDAGVGGDAANAVGRELRAVAEQAQSLCVTHLAQVAARAHHQIKIEKSSGKHEVSVTATPLAAPAREEEIARMLSGKVSDSSLAHARELIENSAA